MEFDELMNKAMKEALKELRKIYRQQEAKKWREEILMLITQNELAVYGMKRYFSYPP